MCNDSSARYRLRQSVPVVVVSDEDVDERWKLRRFGQRGRNGFSMGVACAMIFSATVGVQTQPVRGGGARSGNGQRDGGTSLSGAAARSNNTGNNDSTTNLTSWAVQIPCKHEERPADSRRPARHHDRSLQRFFFS
jgi:hypothetical protein